jgi:hypothetical protein
MKHKKTTEEFVKQLMEKYGNKYIYSLVDYIHKDKNIIIICPIHGKFEVIANSMLRGQGCKKCNGSSKKPKKTNEQFIKEANLIHENFYNYSEVNYQNTHKKVIINCPIHGLFEQTPHNHLFGYGCNKCGSKNTGEKKRLPLNDFLKNSILVHGDKYDYSLVNYLGAHSKVEIICKKHGVFKQNPSSHIKNKSGCPSCYNTQRKLIAPSWTITNWINASKRSKTFDSFKLYVIRCYNETEEFIKIGRTYNTIKRRFSGGQLPYNYEVLKIIISDNGEYIYNLENRVKRKFNGLKYEPKIKFGGMSECFKFL